MRQDRISEWKHALVLVAVWLALTAPPVAAADGRGTAWSRETGVVQSTGDPDRAPDAYGLETNLDFVSGEEFVCSDSTNNCNWWAVDSFNYWGSNVYSRVYAPVKIPAGALITDMRVFYHDEDTGTDLSVTFYRAFVEAAARGRVELASWTSSGTPGYGTAFVDIDPDITVVRRYNVGFLTYGYQSYYLSALLPAAVSHRLRGVAMFWERQISPAPATATFGDVPTNHWAFQHIEALADSGITAGCGSDNYCPDANLTRAQMAVFLAKALGLHWTH